MVLLKLYFSDGTDKTYPSVHQWFCKEGFVAVHREDGYDFIDRCKVIGMQERRIP